VSIPNPRPDELVGQPSIRVVVCHTTYLRKFLHPLVSVADLTIRFVSGQCHSKDDLFSKWSRELGFPAYFGRNWDAFEEMIGDLDWLSVPRVLLVVEKSQELLAGHPADFACLMDILVKAIEDDKQPSRDLAEPSLTVILQCDCSAAEDFATRMLTLGCRIPYLSLSA